MAGGLRVLWGVACKAKESEHQVTRRRMCF